MHLSNSVNGMDDMLQLGLLHWKVVNQSTLAFAALQQNSKVTLTG